MKKSVNITQPFATALWLCTLCDVFCIHSYINSIARYFIVYKKQILQKAIRILNDRTSILHDEYILLD